MDTGDNKDKKFNIAFTTLSDLEKGQKMDAELARQLMTRLEKSGAKKNQTPKPTIVKYTFVKASDLGESSTNQSKLGESSTNQSKLGEKRKREANNPQDSPFYQFI